MAGFSGFSDAEGKFFKALARKNNRDWFQAHKEEYDTGWSAPMKQLLEEVRASIDSAFPHSDLGEPKVFRIFRDVRFAKDKTPYKTHIGGYIPLKVGPTRATNVPMALYFHVGATEVFGAAGHYMMEPPALARFRAAVADDTKGKQLEKILSGLRKKGFHPDSHDSLKRIPKGFDPDHPRAEYLKMKGLTVGFPDLPKGILATSKLPKWLAGNCKAAAPLVEWLLFATQ